MKHIQTFLSYWIQRKHARDDFHSALTLILQTLHTLTSTSITSTSTRSIYDLISTFTSILHVCDDITMKHILTWRHDNVSAITTCVHIYEHVIPHITSSRIQHVIQYDLLTSLQHMITRGWENSMGMHDIISTPLVTSPSYIDLINTIATTTSRIYPKSSHVGTCIRPLSHLMSWFIKWNEMLSRCSQSQDNTAASKAAHVIGPTQWRSLLALITPTSSLPSSTPSFRPTLSKITRAKATTPTSIEQQLTSLIDLFNGNISYDFGYDLLMANDGDYETSVNQLLENTLPKHLASIKDRKRYINPAIKHEFVVSHRSQGTGLLDTDDSEDAAFEAYLARTGRVGKNELERTNSGLNTFTDEKEVEAVRAKIFDMYTEYDDEYDDGYDDFMSFQVDETNIVMESKLEQSITKDLLQPNSNHIHDYKQDDAPRTDSHDARQQWRNDEIARQKQRQDAEKRVRKPSQQQQSQPSQQQQQPQPQPQAHQPQQHHHQPKQQYKPKQQQQQPRHDNYMDAKDDDTTRVTSRGTRGGRGGRSGNVVNDIGVGSRDWRDAPSIFDVPDASINSTYIAPSQPVATTANIQEKPDRLTRLYDATQQEREKHKYVGGGRGRGRGRGRQQGDEAVDGGAVDVDGAGAGAGADAGPTSTPHSGMSAEAARARQYKKKEQAGSHHRREGAAKKRGALFPS